MATNPEAIRFWSEMTSYEFLPMITGFTLQSIDSKYNLDTYDQALAEMDQFLRNNLGYSVTYEEILDAYDEAKNTALSFWNGSYFLFDETDQYHILLVSDNSLQLQVDGLFQDIASTNYTFQAGRLTLTGDVSGTLTFSMPAQPDLLQDPGQWLASRSAFQRQCAGTVTVNANTANPKTLNLIGKVGCYTPTGARDADHCDSIDRWMGLYNVMAGTTLIGGAVNYVHPAAGMTIGQDPSQQDPNNPDAPIPIVLTLPTVLDVLDQSTLVISEYRYFNNAISWDDTLYGDTAGQLMFYLQLDGTLTISGTISVDEQDWYITAHLRTPIAATSPTPITPTALKLAAQATDTGLSITTVNKDLPYGLIGTAYIPYTLAASGGQAPYTWSAVTDMPKGLTLSTDGKLAGTPTVDKKGGYTVSVSVKDAANHTASKDLTITILDDVLTITTTALMDATVYDDYSCYLDATGGDPATYTWSCAEGQSLPPGLILDAKTGHLSGKINETYGSGAFSFKIVLKSTVSGQELQTSKSFTLKAAAAFAPKDILAAITTCFNILVGGGLLKLILDSRDKTKKDAKDAKAGGAAKTKAEAEREDAVAFLKAYNADAERAHQRLTVVKEWMTKAGQTKQFTDQFGNIETRIEQAKIASNALALVFEKMGDTEADMTKQLDELDQQIKDASGDVLRKLEAERVRLKQEADQLRQDIQQKDAQLQQEKQRADQAEADKKKLEDTAKAVSDKV